MFDANTTPPTGCGGTRSKNMKKVALSPIEECQQEISSVNDSALFDILREL